MTIFLWILKNWRLVAALGGVLALLGGLALAHHKGYQACRADDIIAQAAALIEDQKTGINALNVEMLASGARNADKNRLLTEIGKSHETNDDAPAPAIIRNAVAGLYNAHP